MGVDIVAGTLIGVGVILAFFVTAEFNAQFRRRDQRERRDIVRLFALSVGMGVCSLLGLGVLSGESLATMTPISLAVGTVFGVAIAAYGSWNIRTASYQESLMKRLRRKLDEAVSRRNKTGPSR